MKYIIKLMNTNIKNVFLINILLNINEFDILVLNDEIFELDYIKYQIHIMNI
jgi:hypothetical protein